MSEFEIVRELFCGLLKGLVPKFARSTWPDFSQCCTMNVDFELHIGIESKISISNIGFDFEMGEFCCFDYDMDMIFIQSPYQ